MAPYRRLGTALALAGFALVLIATLSPMPDPEGMSLTTPLLCLVCGELGGADVVVNLLLFLPLAIGLRLSGASWRRTVLAALLLSFTVELLQLRVVPGRDASLSDVVTNTTSGAIGATLGSMMPGLVSPRPRWALNLLLGGLTTAILLLTVLGWLLGPELPPGQLVSRWAHEGPGFDVFDGRVVSLRLDGVLMPRHGPPPGSATLRARLDRGAFSLDADLISGQPTRDRLWIYRLDDRSGGGLHLNQFRRQVGVSLPARAPRFLLRHPIVTLPEGLPDRPGVPVRLEASEAGGRVRLASRYGGAERTVELAPSPAFGWILFLPMELAEGTAVRWVTGLLLAAMFLPLGYWAGLTPSRARGSVVLAVGLVVALGLVPAAVGLPPVHWSEWLAAALGATAGWALRRPAAYLQGRCASPSDSEFSSS